MTVDEFLQIHPDEDVDLQVQEGRIFLERSQIRRLRAGKPVILCETGAKDARYIQAEELVYLAHQTGGLWRISAAHDPKLEKPVRHWPKLKRGILR